MTLNAAERFSQSQFGSCQTWARGCAEAADQTRSVETDFENSVQNQGISKSNWRFAFQEFAELSRTVFHVLSVMKNDIT